MPSPFWNAPPALTVNGIAELKARLAFIAAKHSQEAQLGAAKAAQEPQTSGARSRSFKKMDAAPPPPPVAASSGAALALEKADTVATLSRRRAGSGQSGRRYRSLLPMAAACLLGPLCVSSRDIQLLFDRWRRQHRHTESAGALRLCRTQLFPDRAWRRGARHAARKDRRRRHARTGAGPLARPSRVRPWASSILSAACSTPRPGITA